MNIKTIFHVALFLGLITNLLAQPNILTQEKALEILSKSKPELIDNFNVYVHPQPLDAKSKIQYIRTISTPDSASWFFFVDEKPYESWSHTCSYIFVNKLSGSIKIIKSDFPPELSKMKALKLKSIPLEGKHFSFNKNNLKTLTLDISHDYAIIISGGMDNCNNYYRYWNDCSAIYSALVNIYGYDKSHIKVLISDGTSSGQDRVLSVTFDQWGNFVYTRDSSPQDLDGDGTNDINYSATKANIQTVFNNLSGILTSQDHLFIFTTDHGGQDAGSDVFMNLWGEVIRDDELAIEVNKVNPGKINIVMGQCHSGGFIDDLTGNSRIIETACTQDQVSYARTGLTYDEFLYHWISAIGSETPEGTLVNADGNSDGWISIQEAFNYAVNHDIAAETPQYNSPTVGLGCISKLASNWYLPLTNPTIVCSSGATFTVNYVPAGCTVYWDKSSNITLPSDRTTNPIVATANANGTGWVRATIISSTCGSVTLPDFPVSVRMGAPSRPGNIGFRRAGGTCYYQAFISPVTGADSYDWSEDNVNWDLDSGTSYGLFDPYSTVTVYVRARNGCGVSPTKSKTQTMGNTPPDCTWRPVQIITDSTKSVSTVSDNIIIYPNPAESEVTVCVSDVSPASDEDVNISSVAIIDSYGQTRKILHYGSGLKSVTINISDLPNGFYYIRLNNNAAGKSYKLLIQK